MGHAMEASGPAAEPMREDEEEEEEQGEGMGETRRKGSSSTEDLVLRQVPAPQWAMPMAPRLCGMGPSIQVAR